MILIYYFYRLAGFILPRIPPSVGYKICEWIGDLAYLFGGQGRENVRDNMRHVLGSMASAAEVERYTREVFRNQVKNYYDMFRLPALSAEDIDKLVEVEGWEHLQAAQEMGKGTIIAAAHFGNFDAVGQVLPVHGYKVNLVLERLRPPQLFDYICALRASKGMNVVPVDRLRELFKALKRNEIIGLAIDRDIAKGGMVLAFFGAPAQLPIGHIDFSRRKGVPVVVAYCVRRADNTFVARAYPPLVVADTGDKEADLQTGMRQIVQHTEEFIGAYPGQWTMFRRIWESYPSPRRNR